MAASCDAYSSTVQRSHTLHMPGSEVASLHLASANARYRETCLAETIAAFFGANGGTGHSGTNLDEALVIEDSEHKARLTT